MKPSIPLIIHLQTPAENDPGVVCIQEWWGAAPWTRAQAQLIADKGFRVIVPDLYRGDMSLEAKEAEHLMSGLDWPGAVEDVKGAVQYLHDNGSKKVGITGFCMGGALTLACGVLVDGVQAIAPFYGTPPLQLADVSKMKVPVLAHFGEKDDMEGFSDPASAKALGEALKQSGCEHEILLMQGVGHGFMNDLILEGFETNRRLGRPTDPGEAGAAFGNLMRFFEVELGE